MPLPLLLIPILPGIKATTSYALYVAGGTLLLGANYFFGQKKDGNSEAERERRELQQELDERNAVRDRNLAGLIATTERHLTEMALNTASITQQLQQNTDGIAEGSDMVHDTGLQLLNVFELLEKVSKALDDGSQPFFVELNKRLSVFSLTQEELILARDALQNANEQLQATVQRHEEVQKNLQLDITRSQEIIQTLTEKLNEAVEQLASPNRGVDDEKRLSAENQKLKEQLTSAGLIINKQNGELNALRTCNKALQEKITSGATEADGEDEDRKTPRTATFTLFR